MSRARSTPLIEVRDSTIHGWGVFARCDLSKDVCVVEYTGQRVSPEEGDRRYPENGSARAHTFLFSLTTGRYIDAGVRGNLARFINHSCAPNCRSVEENGRIFIETIKRISAGTELTYDYKLTLPADWPHASAQTRYACDCGSPRCRRTLLNLPRPKRTPAKPTQFSRAGNRNHRRSEAGGQRDLGLHGARSRARSPGETPAGDDCKIVS